MLTSVGPFIVYLLSFPAMLAAVFRVEIGILFFILFIPIISVMKKMVAYPAGDQIGDLLLISMILGWFFASLKEKRKVFESSAMNWVVLLIIGGSILNLIRGYTFMGFSEEVDLIRLQAWKNYMILPAIYFVAMNNIRSENLLRNIIICVCLTMLVMDFNFYTTFRWFKTEHYSHQMRISGAFSFLGPNEMAIFYTMYTFLLLGISYFVDDKKLKYFMLLVCLCNFYPIVYSYSRDGYACALIGLLALGFLKDRKLLIILVGIVVLYKLVLPTSVVERIDMTFLDRQQVSQEEQQASAFEVGDVTLELTGRKHLWEKAITYFEHEPLLGIGFDTFRHQEGWITHSLYMRILAEQGLIGAMIFLIYIFSNLWNSYRLFRHSESKWGKGIGLGFFACVMVHMVGSFSGDQSLYYNLMAIFWLFMGIVANLNRSIKVEEKVTTWEEPSYLSRKNVS